MIEFEIPFPPSVNRYWRHTAKAGFLQTYISPKGRRYREDVLAAVYHAFGGRPEPLTGPLRMEIVLRPPDGRIRDVDNHHKAPLDALALADVYGNDKQVWDLHIHWDVSETGRIIRTPGGRALIRIEPLVITADLFDKHNTE